MFVSKSSAPPPWRLMVTYIVWGEGFSITTGEAPRLSHHSNDSAQVGDADAMKRQRNGDVQDADARVKHDDGALHHLEHREIDEEIADCHVDAKCDLDAAALAGARGPGSLAEHAARRRINPHALLRRAGESELRRFDVTRECDVEPHARHVTGGAGVWPVLPRAWKQIP